MKTSHEIVINNFWSWVAPSTTAKRIVSAMRSVPRPGRTPEAGRLRKLRITIRVEVVGNDEYPEAR